jgi:uncharacterized protein YlxP (DUF503 family)
MIIGSIILSIHIPWVHSLKEKRRILKSLVAKTRQKFNVAIAEVQAQDHHQTIILGLACVTNESAKADEILDQVLFFLESQTDGEIFVLEREFR